MTVAPSSLFFLLLTPLPARAHACPLPALSHVVVQVRGPVGHFKYTKNQYKRVGLIAGGTGLTPCLQVPPHPDP